MRTNYHFQMIAAAATLTILLVGIINGEEMNSTTINSSESACISIENQICVPKCCDIGSSWPDDTYSCQKQKVNQYKYDVYESNYTHINTVSEERNIAVYHRSLTCNQSRLLVDNGIDFSLGIITHNSSMILVDIRAQHISLIPPSNYCVEYSNFTDALEFRVCGKASDPIPTIEYYFYFTFLVLSTISYFVAAAFYIFVLKVTDIHKKCFVGFTISMGFAFLFLIFLHTTRSSKCHILGFFFYLFAVSGFLWLTFLCLDLVVVVRFFNQDPRVERWWYYIGAAIVYPAVTLFISIIPDGTIDVPNSFVKKLYNGQKSCAFFNPRLEPFFVSVGLLMLASLVFLILTIYFIRVNNRDYRNNFSWLDQRSSYKYMFRSCLLIWIISLVWVVETGISESYIDIKKTAIYLIQSVQGICTFLIFVSNRYMRKGIINRCRKPDKNDRNEFILEQLGAFENENNRLNRQESTDLINNQNPQPNCSSN